jgi:cytochrome c553
MENKVDRRLTRWLSSGRRLWLSIATVSIAMSAFFATVVAWSQSAETKAQPRREPLPYWAFAVDPATDTSHAQAEPVDNTPRHVPGSIAAFTLKQTQDFFNAPDWHPDHHPAMPKIVAHGRKPDVFACSYCHLPNGQGRPENSSLAGLPVVYIVQQMADFRSGLRKSSETRPNPVAAMIAIGAKATEKETEAAAEYFSGLKPKPWIRVVETMTVPKTHFSGLMLVPSEPGGMESIGQRIIETAENVEQTELRNDASGFIAYVPMGTIKKGEVLVSTGGAGKTTPCASCHGPDLKGQANVPSIAGRSPSYVVRQIYDIQSGARAGVANQSMKAVVANLSVNDMVAIAAYTASLNP